MTLAVEDSNSLLDDNANCDIVADACDAPDVADDNNYANANWWSHLLLIELRAPWSEWRHEQLVLELQILLKQNTALLSIFRPSVFPSTWHLTFL